MGSESDTGDQEQELDDYQTDYLGPRVALAKGDKAGSDERRQSQGCEPPEVVFRSELPVNHPSRVVPSVSRVEGRSRGKLATVFAMTQDGKDERGGKADHGPRETECGEQDAQPRIISADVELIQRKDEDGEEEDEALPA